MESKAKKWTIKTRELKGSFMRKIQHLKEQEFVAYYLTLLLHLHEGRISKISNLILKKATELGFSRATAWRIVKRIEIKK